MNQYLDDALEELKRVDHLVIVSLKYTRTVDVIKSVIDRLISTFDCIIDAVIDHLKEKKKITNPPQNTGLKIDLIQKTLKNDIELHNYLAFYSLVKKIARSPYTKKEEYRRHVTMITTIDDGTVINVDIDLLTEYFEKTKNFLKYVRVLIEGPKNE